MGGGADRPGAVRASAVASSPPYAPRGRTPSPR